MDGYLAPDGAYTATFPSARRRAVAALVDWTLAYVLFLLASIVAGVFQAVGWTSWTAGDLRGIPGGALLVFSQLLVAVPVVGYFAYYCTTGSTLGMRAVEIELVEPDTGRPPGVGRAVARSLTAFVVAIAVNNVYLVVASDPLDGYSAFQQALIDASWAVVALTAVAKAAMLVDVRRRTLFDRLFSLLYVEEIVFAQRARWPWTTSGRA